MAGIGLVLYQKLFGVLAIHIYLVFFKLYTTFQNLLHNILHNYDV